MYNKVREQYKIINEFYNLIKWININIFPYNY